MQKIKNVPVIVLSVFVSFSVLFVSCGKKQEKTVSLVPETKITYSDVPVQIVHNERPASSETEGGKIASGKKPDIDLTLMSATMIYSTVFQFLIDWENYEGKVIRIRGVYTPFFREERGKLYHNVVVQDATACCKEGLEFVWGDGSHPDSDYPESGTELIVTGVFEQYYEDDKMEVMQIRLRDAEMDIVE